MSDSSIAVTTRQAAEILGVHESSIKRWCSTDNLPYFQTNGGHRRILVNELLRYAHRNEINSPFHLFGDFAGRVWQGMLDVDKDDDYSLLITLGATWMKQSLSHLFLDLLVHLKNDKYRVADLADLLIAPIMRQLGDEYMSGSVSIGEEHRVTYAMRDVLVQFSAFLRAENRNRLDRSETALNTDKTAVLGCARSQEHELGALLARLILEDQGFSVVYLGLDVPTEEFAKQQVTHAASIVCIALMPPMSESEVNHIAELLDYMYDRRMPYHLIFGGPIRLDFEKIQEIRSNLLSLEFYSRMSDFAEWVNRFEAGSA